MQAGGTGPNPNYAKVWPGVTGHAESVQSSDDPDWIAEGDLLGILFTTHDPTQLNGQGNDVGTQYRSAIFYSSPEEKALAERVIAEVANERIWPGKIVTTLEPLKAFYPAEEYHQNYYERYEKGSDGERASMNSGYCRFIIEPKVRKFREKYASRLKK